MRVLAFGKETAACGIIENMRPLPRSQDVYRPGRIYKEWTRLAPEYGEQFYVCRQDYSKTRSFYDAFQLFINWKFWKGLFLQKNPTWDRFASCHVAAPFAYKLDYQYHGMGQHHSTFEFWLLNVVYLKWFRSYRIDTKTAVRFKQRYGREVFRYADIQVKEENERDTQRRQAATV
jgi:hypothetical protein